MGELGVPDRYVDVFQGRAPRTVIAKHYTGKVLERLKRIYYKAGLKILENTRRISLSVFTRNYFNLVRIQNLKEHTSKRE